MCSVTSATEPASDTMNTFIMVIRICIKLSSPRHFTFMDCETWRPVSTAVFISSQLCDEQMVKKLQSY